MNYKYLLTGIFTATVFFTVQSLLAQETYDLTVNELFQKGIENSLRLKSAQINASIAKEAEGTAKAAQLPDIGINVIGGYIGDPTVFMSSGLARPTRSDIPNWLQNYDVTLTQPLFYGGKIKHNMDKASLFKEIALLSAERDEAEIKLLLIGKYLGLFQLYKSKDVMGENIKDAKQSLHDIQAMKKEGMVTENDFIRSELELTNYELSLREINDNIEIVSQQLDIALGLDEKLLLMPDTTELNALHPVLSYEQYVEEAYNQYPELKISQLGIKLAEKNLKITKADYLPSLAFKATNFLDRPILKTTPAIDYFTNSWGVSLVLSYNLSSLYHNKHNVNASKEAVSLQQLQEELQKQNIRTGVKSAYIKHKEAIDRVIVLQTSVKLANENYRIVRNKYFNQLSVLTDLLDATSVRLRAELQLTEAKANVIYTYYELLKSSGNI